MFLFHPFSLVHWIHPLVFRRVEPEIHDTTQLSLFSVSRDFFRSLLSHAHSHLCLFRFSVFLLRPRFVSSFCSRIHRPTIVHHLLNKRIFRSIYFFFFFFFVRCEVGTSIPFPFFDFNINAFSSVGSIIMSHVKMLRQFVLLCWRHLKHPKISETSFRFSFLLLPFPLLLLLPLSFSISVSACFTHRAVTTHGALHCQCNSNDIVLSSVKFDFFFSLFIFILLVVDGNGCNY